MKSARSVGIALVWLLVIEALTGTTLILAGYRAETQTAHATVVRLRDQQPLAFVYGVHHWLSSIILLLFSAVLFLWIWNGAYRSTLRKTWMAWLILFAIAMLFQLTGHLLPWDSHAVRTANVEIGIAAGVPRIGPGLADAVRGGSTTGLATLQLWYLTHVLTLPLTALAMTAVLWAVERRSGSEQIRVSRLVIIIGVLTAAALAVAFRPPLYPPATSADVVSQATKPEWYVLPLHAMVTMARGINSAAGWLGSAAIPGVAFAVVALLPWRSRRSSGASVSIRFALLASFAVLVALCAPLALRGYAGGLYIATLSGDPRLPPDPLTYPDIGVSADSRRAERGRELYSELDCASCHRLGGVGKNEGPPLDGVGRRIPSVQWQKEHLLNPAKVAPGSTMPSLAQIVSNERPTQRFTEEELEDLGHYLTSLQ